MRLSLRSRETRGQATATSHRGAARERKRARLRLAHLTIKRETMPPASVALVSQIASAEPITLRQTTEAIEGPIALLPCLAPWEGCDRMDDSPIYPAPAEPQDQLVAVLDATTLQDLAKDDGARPGGDKSQEPVG